MASSSSPSDDHPPPLPGQDADSQEERDSSPEVEVPPHPIGEALVNRRNRDDCGNPEHRQGMKCDHQDDQGPVNERLNRSSQARSSYRMSSSSTSSSSSSSSQGEPYASCEPSLPVSSRASNQAQNLSSTSLLSNPRTNPLALPSNLPCGTTYQTRNDAPRPTTSSSASGEALFNWQASKCCVKERLSAIFNRETLADVHFLVGRAEHVMRIPGHKFVLSIGSAVFDAMFNGKMATQETEIALPDIEPAAFLSLLKFLYTDEVHIGPETVMTTLYTAKKYAVPALENQCVDFLKQNLSSDNAFMLLTQARLFDESALAQTCLESIDKNTVGASEAEGFLEIDHDTLCAVLERDTLRIREVVLFNAVVRWAESECLRQGLPNTPHNQRAVLGRALFFIRFPLMNIEEFASEVAQSGLLTDREVVNLFLYFTVNPKPSVEFPDVPRSSITGKEHVMQRFSKTESRWGYSGTSDRIRFSVDRKIFLVAFGLYGSIHGPSTYDVSIQVIQTGSGKVLGTNETSFACDGTSHTFRVTFKHPVEIQPNTNYTASATLKGPDSHYGTEGRRKAVVDLQGGKRVTFQFQYAAGCNNGTSVEDGQIPEFIFYT